MANPAFSAIGSIVCVLCGVVVYFVTFYGGRYVPR